MGSFGGVRKLVRVPSRLRREEVPVRIEQHLGARPAALSLDPLEVRAPS
jgi:hypothetical protein